MKISEGIQEFKTIGKQISKRLAGRSALGVAVAVGVSLGAVAGAALLFAKKGNIKARLRELVAKLTPRPEEATVEAVAKPVRLNSHERRARAPIEAPGNA